MKRPIPRLNLLPIQNAVKPSKARYVHRFAVPIDCFVFFPTINPGLTYTVPSVVAFNAITGVLAGLRAGTTGVAARDGLSGYWDIPLLPTDTLKYEVTNVVTGEKTYKEAEPLGIAYNPSAVTVSDYDFFVLNPYPAVPIGVYERLDTNNNRNFESLVGPYDFQPGNVAGSPFMVLNYPWQVVTTDLLRGLDYRPQCTILDFQCLAPIFWMDKGRIDLAPQNSDAVVTRPLYLMVVEDISI